MKLHIWAMEMREKTHPMHWRYSGDSGACSVLTSYIEHVNCAFKAAYDSFRQHLHKGFPVEILLFLQLNGLRIKTFFIKMCMMCNTIKWFTFCRAVNQRNHNFLLLPYTDWRVVLFYNPWERRRNYEYNCG